MPTDDKLAFQYFRTVALMEGHYHYALYCIAHCYQYGDCVTRNIKEAMRWRRLAAEQGSNDARYQLGSELCRGEDYCVKDMRQGIRYHRLAAVSNNPSAVYELRKFT